MKRGYSIVELVIVLGVFSVFYFGASWVISGELNVNYEDELYEQKLAYIVSQTKVYATYNDELFKEDDIVYKSIGELAQLNAIHKNTETDVYDPRDKEKTLNNIKVKIEKKDDKIEVKVLS